MTVGHNSSRQYARSASQKFLQVSLGRKFTAYFSFSRSVPGPPFDSLVVQFASQCVHNEIANDWKKLESVKRTTTSDEEPVGFGMRGYEKVLGFSKPVPNIALANRYRGLI
jgi:hypothetical protein